MQYKHHPCLTLMGAVGRSELTTESLLMSARPNPGDPDKNGVGDRGARGLPFLGAAAHTSLPRAPRFGDGCSQPEGAPERPGDSHQRNSTMTKAINKSSVTATLQKSSGRSGEKVSGH